MEDEYIIISIDSKYYKFVMGFNSYSTEINQAISGTYKYCHDTCRSYYNYGGLTERIRPVNKLQYLRKEKITKIKDKINVLEKEK